MPGPEESRTPYPLLAKQTLYQMSYRPMFIVVNLGPDGLEPSTLALSTRCSNQLSYRPNSTTKSAFGGG